MSKPVREFGKSRVHSVCSICSVFSVHSVHSGHRMQRQGLVITDIPIARFRFVYSVPR